MPVSRASTPDLTRPGLADIEGGRAPPQDGPRLTENAKRIIAKLNGNPPPHDR